MLVVVIIMMMIGSVSFASVHIYNTFVNFTSFASLSCFRNTLHIISFGNLFPFPCRKFVRVCEECNVKSF